MQNNSNSNSQKVITFGEFSQKVKSHFRFLSSKWKWILLFMLFGSIFGFLISILTPVRYVSKVTFVVEESKSIGGGLSAIAGQFGFDLGGGGGGGVFSGENLLLFLKSETLCRQTLLSYYDDKKTVTLADRYAEVMRFKAKWEKSSKIGNVSFAQYVNKKMPRKEDSLLQLIIKKNILLKDLSVSKPDKKASFIQVAISTRDEKLSALFVERLVEIATSKYIESKLKLKINNVAMLQKRADSLSAILNNKTYDAASSQQSLVDLNPALKKATITAEISTREKSLLVTIFAEVVKNLEIAKTFLSQETPSIEIVDRSTLPLEQIKVNAVKSIIQWGIIFVVLSLLFFSFKSWLTFRK